MEKIMLNTQILEMINNGSIEELKKQLQEEIYVEALSGENRNSAARYKAMKKYVTSGKHLLKDREALQNPCKISGVKHNNQDVTAFTNGFSIVLTTEPTGNINLCPNSDRYMNVAKFFKYENLPSEKVNINELLAQAKSEGYNFKQSSLANNGNYKYYVKHNNAVFTVTICFCRYVKFFRKFCSA